MVLFELQITFSLLVLILTYTKNEELSIQYHTTGWLNKRTSCGHEETCFEDFGKSEAFTSELLENIENCFIVNDSS